MAVNYILGQSVDYDYVVYILRLSFVVCLQIAQSIVYCI